MIKCNLKTTLFVAAALGLAVTATAQDSLDIKIGQMILIGFPKAEVDTTVLEEVRKGKAGSIILFEKNIPKSAAAFIALKKIIWTYQQAAPIPLLVTIDQEGGKVNRLKDRYGFPRTITAQEMGISDDSTRFYAEAIASTLAGLGINVNLAPCIDLGINPANTVIYGYGRAFSAQPDTVARRAATFIRAHHRMNVLTVLKHFPGHGSSLADSHYGMADVTKTWTEAELIPYRKLLEQGLVDAIMTAHIVNMRLDPKGLPGTLSSRMVDSLLRKQMNFKGVVFSDDMQMQAITKHYGLEEAIRLAIQAGVDILCFSNNLPGSEERTVDRVHRIIRTFVEKGIISEQRIDESYRRIMRLKRKLYPASIQTERPGARETEDLGGLMAELAELKTELQKLKSEMKESVREEKKSSRRKKDK
jgi:beta-N-acetylhexosaminidase